MEEGKIVFFRDVTPDRPPMLRAADGLTPRHILEHSELSDFKQSVHEVKGEKLWEEWERLCEKGLGTDVTQTHYMQVSNSQAIKGKTTG